MKYSMILLILPLVFSHINAIYGDTSCYSTTKRFYNDCSDSSGFYSPKVATFLTVGSKSLMLINTNFMLLVFDIANPELPKQIGSLVMPFPLNCGLPFGCNDPHFQYEDTLWPVSASAIGNIGYAFAPLNGYGWDLLKVAVSGTNVTLSWFNTGYHAPGNGGPYLYGALFTDGSQFYIVGQMLDSSSVAAGDKSIRIYSLGATPPADLYNSIGPGVRVPVGGANDPEPYKSALLIMGKHQFFVANVGSKRILMVYSTGLYPSSKDWIAFFDITNPISPIPAGFISYAADPNLFSGAVAFEAEANRFWVAKPAGGTAATVTIYGYQLTEGGGSASLSQVSGGTWPLGSQTGAGIPVVAAGQGLLVFGWMQVGKAFVVSPAGLLSPLPDEPGYTDLSVNLEEPCQYWDLARGYTGLGVFPGSDGVYFYRGAMKEGRMIRVSSECLNSSTTDAGTDINTDSIAQDIEETRDLQGIEDVNDLSSSDMSEISDINTIDGEDNTEYGLDIYEIVDIESGNDMEILDTKERSDESVYIEVGLDEESQLSDVPSRDIPVYDFSDHIEGEDNASGCSCNFVE